MHIINKNKKKHFLGVCDGQIPFQKTILRFGFLFVGPGMHPSVIIAQHKDLRKCTRTHTRKKGTIIIFLKQEIESSRTTNLSCSLARLPRHYLFCFAKKILKREKKQKINPSVLGAFPFFILQPTRTCIQLSSVVGWVRGPVGECSQEPPAHDVHCFQSKVRVQRLND